MLASTRGAQQFGLHYPVNTVLHAITLVHRTQATLTHTGGYWGRHRLPACCTRTHSTTLLRNALPTGRKRAGSLAGRHAWSESRSCTMLCGLIAEAKNRFIDHHTAPHHPIRRGRFDSCLLSVLSLGAPLRRVRKARRAA